MNKEFLIQGKTIREYWARYQRVLRPFRYTLLIMKITALLTVVFTFQVSALTFGQQISLSYQKASLKTVIRSLSNQGKIDFVYKDRFLEQANPVTVELKNVSVDNALQQVFRNQPFSYQIEDGIVYIMPRIAKEQGKGLSNEVDKRQQALRGRVTNDKGENLVGASVRVKNTKIATGTNELGAFELNNVPEDAIIVVTHMAYEKQEITVSKSSATLQIVLKPATNSLDETIVQAYGTTSKRYNIGSISQISAADIEKQPVMNLLQTMQGLIPGVTINTTGGAPGAQQRIQLRGQNTIMNTNYGALPFDQPLILIDGIPYAPQNNSFIASAAKLGGSSGMSPLNSINPADIESITVLKDADATSIYGSQGLNGVVLITTKKGIAGKTTLKVDAYTAPERSAKIVSMLNTEQYLALRKEALTNDGMTDFSPTPGNIANYPELFLFDQSKYTNWYKEFYGGTATNNTINASLTGGKEGVNYIISSGFTKATYNFPGDFKNERASVHTGFSYNPAESKLSVDFGTDFSYNLDKSAALELTKALLLPPNLPDMLNPDGSLVWNYNGFNFTSYQMQGSLLTRSKLINKSMNSSLRIAYRILPGLKISSNIGYSYFYSDQLSQAPRSSYPPSQGSFSNARFSDVINQTLNVEPQLEYQKNISKGRLTVLFGGTYKNNSNTQDIISSYNYANDALLGSPNGGSTKYLTNTNSPYKYMAAFGRINYIHDGKYIANVTGRRDGSSNFGPNRQFGNFGSAGLGWIISEEAFFAKAVPFINFAKLSTNYGTVGSDGIGAYMFQDYWFGSGSGTFQGLTPYMPNKLFNPDFSWGVKKMWNASSEISLLNSRLNLNLSWYQNRTSNQLTTTPLPTQTGFSSVLQNLDATVENKGWEIFVSSENVKRDDFSWSSSFNITINRNKLIAYKGLESSPYRDMYKIGQSTSTLYLFDYKGVNSETGVFEFYKADGVTPVYSPLNPGAYGASHDRTAMMDLQPRFTGGLTNSFSYKGFDLSFLFQFAKQKGYNHLYNLVTEDYKYNKPSAIFDLQRWQQPGDEHADLQRLTDRAGTAAANAVYYFRNSTGAFGDASYIRLKNLSLSHRFSGAWLQNAKIQHFRLFMNIQNLFTITGYKLGDPEMNGNLYGIPPQRTIAFGTSLTF
ncbi:SusC/RagA family TonB-linked outer membrane protein [Sphingobacterium yanglingense]|uniref:TonB-linked SusC/RagA family outer membrane protein n=1 Tax=Sphingobacterium yanglingense TaxID=1437280 RepID=A0A4R6WHN8_9SPHI|nr:SusC/RagA family TonB-linked outer membrane protein [Sphingobacterium yanglingense]TDQ77917.1 TonB-linked SusC/RagA family outer membrane protein [Sphingobacterium yanglingense]